MGVRGDELGVEEVSSPKEAGCCESGMSEVERGVSGSDVA
jgi:hypothetical protein